MNISDTSEALVPGPGQYNAYLSDLSSLGGRYMACNTFYLAVVSALLGLLSLKADGAAQLSQVLRVCVPLFGIGVCFAWHQNIAHYRLLFQSKFAVLREMEIAAKIFPAFKIEEQYYDAKAPRWLLRNDLAVPLYLALPFAAVLLTVLSS
jgi:hypothetical protein